jgi:hypothetical protein
MNVTQVVALCIACVMIGYKLAEHEREEDEAFRSIHFRLARLEIQQDRSPIDARGPLGVEP